MPSFQDSAVIFFIALLLFGPKKLPELARYVGKLMGEFRRASSEFRMQMEDEFRVAEQAEQQKKIAAIEAAAPVAPVVTEGQTDYPQALLADAAEHGVGETPPEPTPAEPTPVSAPPESAGPEPAPLPIASSGDLHLMPPATGLPVARASSSHGLGGLFDSIPHAPDPAAANTEGHG